MPSVFCQRMMSSAWSYASCGFPWCRFRIERVDAVEDEDGEDLAPPVEAAAVAETSARPAACRWSGTLGMAESVRPVRRRSWRDGGRPSMAASGGTAASAMSASASAAACLSRLPDREQRRAEQAHDQRHAVPEEADADRLARWARRAGGAGARADLRGCRAPRARSGAPAPSPPRGRRRAPRRRGPRRRARGSRTTPRRRPTPGRRSRR